MHSTFTSVKHLLFFIFLQSAVYAADDYVAVPHDLTDYEPIASQSLWDIWTARILEEPFNAIGTIIFFLSIIHTFCAPKFMELAAYYEKKDGHNQTDNEDPKYWSFRAELCYFLGEVEVVFMLWILPLFACMSAFFGQKEAIDYLQERNFAEPIFVVAIMAIAATRPVLTLAERVLAGVASLLGNTPKAWWFTVLTLAPILGSFITEPAAMTIGAILLGRQFYSYHPSTTLAYATLGLLFVNTSVGGVLCNFAAPPVLMVAGPWGWSSSFMFFTFGWKAVCNIVVSNVLYLLVFYKELSSLSTKTPALQEENNAAIPLWITCMHLFFLAWVVFNSHYSVIVVGSFLIFLGFVHATRVYQREMTLKTPILVGCFLASLVIHGGLQGWWIEPVLEVLHERTLLLGATVLTAFNDNALITYLTTLAPNFSDSSKYAVVAGAVAGGGLTVIANAPNPAGQLLLRRYFPEGVFAWNLFLGALVATCIQVAGFMFL